VSREENKCLQLADVHHFGVPFAVSMTPRLRVKDPRPLGARYLFQADSSATFANQNSLRQSKRAIARLPFLSISFHQDKRLPGTIADVAISAAKVDKDFSIESVKFSLTIGQNAYRRSKDA
jgi:hypothetical protein